MNDLQEIVQNLGSGFPQDDVVLKEAFDREWDEAFVPRMNIKSYGDRVRYDLGKRNRKPALGAMVILAAIMADIDLLKRLLAFKYHMG